MSGKRERKIVVDEKEYTFLIGKVYVQIRNVESNTKQLVRKSDEFLYPTITPKMISDFIHYGSIQGAERYYPHCGHDDRYVAIDPFQAEIYDRKEHIYMCDHCFEQIALDI